MKRLLVGCETSGRVREAFRALGVEAWSCDILPSDDNSPYHIQDDVLNHLGGWDAAVFHPPCTYLTNSGVRWLYKGQEKDLQRWADLKDAITFFNTLKNAPIPIIAVENPIPHKYARDGFDGIDGIGQYTQLIQPWMFGHGETKATCLWLKGLPKLVPTDIVEGREGRIHNFLLLQTGGN